MTTVRLFQTLFMALLFCVRASAATARRSPVETQLSVDEAAVGDLQGPARSMYDKALLLIGAWTEQRSFDQRRAVVTVTTTESQWSATHLEAWTPPHIVGLSLPSEGPDRISVVVFWDRLRIEPEPLTSLLVTLAGEFAAAAYESRPAASPMAVQLVRLQGAIDFLRALPHLEGYMLLNTTQRASLQEELIVVKDDLRILQTAVRASAHYQDCAQFLRSADN